MLSPVQVYLAQSQLSLLQLALATNDLTPPISAAVAAEEGMKQARKHSYPIPPLAETLAEGRELTKSEFSQLRKYFEENPWVGPPELLFNEDGSERLEKPSQKFIDYLCWGSTGAESWVRSKV